MRRQGKDVWTKRTETDRERAVERRAAGPGTNFIETAWYGRGPFVSDPLIARAHDLRPSEPRAQRGGKRPPDKRRLSASSELRVDMAVLPLYAGGDIPT